MLFISQAYERIWGRTCKSVIEQPLSFIDSTHPEDRKAVIAAFPKQKQGSYDIEHRIVRSDGGIRWIRDKAFRFGTHPARFIGWSVSRRTSRKIEL